MLCNCCGQKIEKIDIHHNNSNCFNINISNKRAIQYLYKHKLYAKNNLVNIKQFLFNKESYSKIYSCIDFIKRDQDWFNLQKIKRLCESKLPLEILDLIEKYLYFKSSKVQDKIEFYVLELFEIDLSTKCTIPIIISPSYFPNYYQNIILSKLNTDLGKTYHFFPKKSYTWFKEIIDLIK